MKNKKQIDYSDKDLQFYLYLAVSAVLENNNGKWDLKGSKTIDIMGYEIKLSAEITGFPIPDHDQLLLDLKKISIERHNTVGIK